MKMRWGQLTATMRTLFRWAPRVSFDHAAVATKLRAELAHVGRFERIQCTGFAFLAAHPRGIADIGFSAHHA